MGCEVGRGHREPPGRWTTWSVLPPSLCSAYRTSTDYARLNLLRLVYHVSWRVERLADCSSQTSEDEFARTRWRRRCRCCARDCRRDCVREGKTGAAR